MYTDFHDQNGNAVAASVVLEAIKNPIIKHSVSAGIVDGIGSAPLTFFTEEDIIRNSFIFTNNCASDGIKLGSVNIGMAKMTVSNERFKDFRAPSVLVDKLIHPIFYLDIDDNITVTVMSGDYWIKEVEQLTEGVRLTCYDSMCKLDEPFTLGTITGTPYQIFTQAATACGLTVSTTQAEMEALPNGTRTFTLHSDNDCKTWRDVLSYLSMLMGCFVTIGRHAYQVSALPGIEVHTFGNGKDSFCDTVTDVHRYKGAKFSIFDTEYKAIDLTAYVVDGQDTVKKDFTYAETTGVTGQTINLGYNPFLQADTPETDLTQTQRDILHELLEQVALYNYTPMQISLPVGFVYDLGDVIKCTGGLANTGFAGGYTEDCYCCISNYTYTYGKEFRIKTLESKAAKARPIVAPSTPAILNVTVVNGTGATITATDGTHTYTATESGGSATISILKAGFYTVTTELDGQTGDIMATLVVALGGTYSVEVGFSNDDYFVLDTLDLGQVRIPVIIGGHLTYHQPTPTIPPGTMVNGVAVKPKYLPITSGPRVGKSEYLLYFYNSTAPHPITGYNYFWWEGNDELPEFGGSGFDSISTPPTAEELEGFVSYGVDLNGEPITSSNRIYLPSENSNITIKYLPEQVGSSYVITDGHSVLSGILNSESCHMTISVHGNRTYTVSVNGVSHGQVVATFSAEDFEVYTYTPDTMNIYTGYNDDKYVITMGDGETYNIPFETARGKVTQNIHEYTHNGVLVRIEFSATETQTNAVTGTIYFNGANPFTFSADAKGSNPSYGVDTTITIPFGI